MLESKLNMIKIRKGLKLVRKEEERNSLELLISIQKKSRTDSQKSPVSQEITILMLSLLTILLSKEQVTWIVKKKQKVLFE